MSKLKALQPKQGEGERSSKETNQENKPLHWLSYRRVSEMFGRGESNKVVELFNYPVGKQADMGRYQMAV